MDIGGTGLIQSNQGEGMLSFARNIWTCCRSISCTLVHHHQLVVVGQHSRPTIQHHTCEHGQVQQHLKKLLCTSEYAKTMVYQKICIFFIFNNFFYVNMNWYLIFMCTVQNNLLPLLFLFSLHIITFLIYYFIYLYLI